MARKALTETDIQQFRETFCKAAYELYQERDFNAISMRGIAKAVGCSPMLAYRYFENKEEVFAALRARLFHRLADQLEQVDNQLPPLVFLHKLGRSYADFAYNEPHAYRLLYLLHVHQSKVYPDVETAQRRTRKALFNGTKRAIEAGDIKGDPVVTAHALWASMHGLVSLDLANQLNQGASFEQLFPQMMEQFLGLSDNTSEEV